LFIIVPILNNVSQFLKNKRQNLLKPKRRTSCSSQKKSFSKSEKAGKYS
jgi:hypothetical protein